MRTTRRLTLPWVGRWEFTRTSPPARAITSLCEALRERALTATPASPRRRATNAGVAPTACAFAADFADWRVGTARAAFATRVRATIVRPVGFGRGRVTDCARGGTRGASRPALREVSGGARCRETHEGSGGLWKSAQSRQLIARGSQIVGPPRVEERSRKTRTDRLTSDVSRATKRLLSSTKPNGLSYFGAPLRLTLRREKAISSHTTHIISYTVKRDVHKRSAFTSSVS